MSRAHRGTACDPETFLRRSWLTPLLLSTGLSLLLSACSGLQTQPSASRDNFRGNIAIRNWQLSGRIGITSAQQAHSGYLNWIQCGAKYEVRINGPLGSGAVKLVGDATQVTLYEGSNDPVTATSAEELLQYYGWELPLSQLRFWIRGVPDPAQDHTETSTGFEQAGWSLAFPRQATVDQFALPAKATAAAKDNTRVTLVIQDWQLKPECEHL